MMEVGNMFYFRHNNLYASKVFETHINSESYDKKQIIKDVTHNYNIEPNRNRCDNVSTIHHSYNDWNNDKFKTVDIQNLSKIYGKIIKQFVNTLSFATEIDYFYDIVNIMASDGTQIMREHDHLSYKDVNSSDRSVCLYSMVHYLSLNPEHTKTTFINPLIFSYCQSLLPEIQTMFRSDDIDNSSYFGYFNLSSVEDDVVIFPSYLKHCVYPGPKTEDLRITVATNICFRKSK